jgi:hypothetical protein
METMDRGRLARMLIGGTAVTLTLVGLNYIWLNVESEILKSKVYRIADTNNIKYLDWDESSQLGKDLGLLGKLEKATPEYIEEKLKSKNSFEKVEMFKKYLESHKKNN